MKHTSYILLLITLLIFSGKNLNAQDTLIRRPFYEFAFSAGSHLNFYQNQGVYGLPFNIQAEMLFNKRNSLGLGYTYDSYKGSSYFFAIKTRPGDIRQNLTCRYLHFFSDYNRIFTTYIGASGGISLWHDHLDSDRVLPTAQFIFGMRIRFFKHFFWTHEFGVGPPFLYQTSLGIKLH